MHYIEGAGDALLFLHGTLSWSFEYRKIIQNLSANCRCIAIDHLGFGLFDKLKDYDYSIQQHSNNVATFIKHMNLKNLVLMLHDFGGPIGLSYAVKHPDKVKKLSFVRSSFVSLMSFSNVI